MNQLQLSIDPGSLTSVVHSRVVHGRKLVFYEAIGLTPEAAARAYRIPNEFIGAFGRYLVAESA